MELEVGGVAAIDGLKAAAQHNGKEARLLEYVAEKGRWRVQLCGGAEVLGVKPDNLTAVAAGYQAAPLNIPGGGAFVVDDFITAEEGALAVQLVKGQAWQPLCPPSDTPKGCAFVGDLAKVPFLKGLAARAQQLCEATFGAKLARAPDRDNHNDYFLWYTEGGDMESHSDVRFDMPFQNHVSAVLTLQLADFEGGEFVFTHTGVAVEPRVGRAVLFRSVMPDGSERQPTIHHVNPVLEGERFAVGFAFDIAGQHYKETDTWMVPSR
eukprot:TRINITY_DN4584_c1_g1_i1.p1 TRINITY_DN4584_c1_g1~~TRINITY_DN4584_c1_g1_i1.p1  ORF type:complete len:266 (+),score=96.40 TRINITY_DN4584_c1_g1_i1:427-1224(+)